MNDDDEINHNPPGLALWAQRLASTPPVPEPPTYAANPCDLGEAARRFKIPAPYMTTVLSALSRFLHATHTHGELCAVRADSPDVVRFLRMAAARILN
jgi:hypothetical protein